MNACKILELATKGNVGKIIELAKQEIQEKSIREKHGVSELKRFKLALKYLKNTEKDNPTYSKSWIKNDLQYFTNGYTFFVLKNHIENLPVTDDIPSVNLDEYLKDYTTKMQNFPIDIADIKAKLKIAKAEKNKKSFRCIYEMGERGYNAEYLIDCYSILGGDNIEFWQPKNGKYFPSVFESTNGKAAIMPIIKPKKEQ